MNKTDTLCLPILSLISSYFRMSRLTFGHNDFRKAPYFFKYFRLPTSAIFGGVNKETMNTMTSHKYSYIEYEEEQVWRVIYRRSELYLK